MAAIWVRASGLQRVQVGLAGAAARVAHRGAGTRDAGPCHASCRPFPQFSSPAYRGHAGQHFRALLVPTQHSSNQ